MMVRPIGVGLADQFSNGFSSGGTIVGRKSVKVGDQNFTDFVKAWPKDFDVVFFAGIREGAPILREMRAQGPGAALQLRRRLLGHEGVHPCRRGGHEHGRGRAGSVGGAGPR